MKSLNIPYKSQLDNQYNPYGACNVTSVAMCLEFLKAKRKTNQGQLEDELYQYCLENRLNRHNPHDLCKLIIAYGIKDIFTENTSIVDVQDWLSAGNPCIFHGYFTRFGHIVVATGFDETGFFVHDPYGEYFHDGYRTDLSGANLHYSYELIQRVCIPDGKFWVHFISNT